MHSYALTRYVDDFLINLLYVHILHASFIQILFPMLLLLGPKITKYFPGLVYPGRVCKNCLKAAFDKLYWMYVILLHWLGICCKMISQLQGVAEGCSELWRSKQIPNPLARDELRQNAFPLLLSLRLIHKLSLMTIRRQRWNVLDIIVHYKILSSH